MLTRCCNPKSAGFKRYGGRGIAGAERWHVFANFVADLPERPSPEHSLDRWPDNDGDYAPGNVRWATQTQQLRNQSRNRLLTFDGQTRCVAEWAEATGLSKFVIAGRIKLGWPVDRTLTTPTRHCR